MKSILLILIVLLIVSLNISSFQIKPITSKKTSKIYKISYKKPDTISNYKSRYGTRNRPYACKFFKQINKLINKYFNKYYSMANLPLSYTFDNLLNKTLND